jgi:ABC-type multidrug transport system ATPase subunit
MDNSNSEHRIARIRSLHSDRSERDSSHSVYSRSKLHFDVSYTAIEKRHKKVILNRVSDVVESGQMLAIMGPSGKPRESGQPIDTNLLSIGAGKTSLLRVLTMEAFGGVAVGTVALNGKTMTSQLFKSKCGIVAQEDYHWAFLTCQETLAYATDLLLPYLSADEKILRVDLMLRKMGLESCRDTLVGNQFMHGLSGGQKRRLSLAVALMKKLEAIFLDEPTSGLDAAAATGILTFLGEITKQEDLITVFTVHQPSTNIFNKFDRVLLLSSGRTAYCGYANEVKCYLFTICHPLPIHMNPAEYLLDIVNMDFTDRQKVFKILDDWEIHGKPDHDHRISTLLVDSERLSRAESVHHEKMPYGHSQTVIMLKRHLLLSLRDPMAYTGRVVLFFICTLFFAIVYIKARVRDQEQALNREWFSNWLIGVPSNMTVIAVYVFNIELLAIKREVRNGMVNPVSYLIANSLIQIPIMLLFGLVVLPVAAYGIMNFQIKNFVEMWLIYSLTMYAFEALAQLLAVSFSNPLLGMLLFINLWFNSFLFSGLFLPIDFIAWPLRVCGYILPFKYTFQLLAYHEFTGTTFDGASPCVYGVDDDCLLGGYKCDHPNGLCYGYTGTQVLETMHKTFSVYSSENMNATYIPILILIAVVAKIGFIVVMTVKDREESKLLPITCRETDASHMGIFSIASGNVSPV